MKLTQFCVKPSQCNSKSSNPLYTKSFWGKRDLYLHFLPPHNITQIAAIFPVEDNDQIILRNQVFNSHVINLALLEYSGPS